MQAAISKAIKVLNDSITETSTKIEDIFFHNKQVDMWSVGCIVAEMYLKEAIFPGNSR
jgi:hypothetical protein